jgi:hypothetical protein
MKPEWLIYAEQIRKEIDQMRAKKGGKNVERRLFSTWRQACDQKLYPGSLGDWEILIRTLGRTGRPL